MSRKIALLMIMGCMSQVASAQPCIHYGDTKVEQCVKGENMLLTRPSRRDLLVAVTRHCDLSQEVVMPIFDSGIRDFSVVCVKK